MIDRYACKNCQSDRHLKNKYRRIKNDADRFEVAVICEGPQCNGISGPYKETPNEAVLAWNKLISQ